MWASDICFTKICASKEVHLIEDSKTITIKLPTVAQRINDSDIGFLYSILKDNLQVYKTNLSLSGNSHWELVHELITNPLWTNTKETKYFRIKFAAIFSKIFKSYQFTPERNLLWDGVIVTEELWKWFTYVMLYIDGSKDLVPPDKKTPLTDKQAELQAKIKRIKEQGKGTSTDIEDTKFMDMFILIQYAFPGVSYDNLWNMTIKELLWLRDRAQAAASYDIERIAYSTGNLKKKKLDFFLK